MAYIELKEMTIAVLDGFETAAFVNECVYRKNNGSDLFHEHELDDAIEYGYETWIVRPLSDDQFKYWSITPVNPVSYHKRYTVKQILSEYKPLYYVNVNDRTIEKALKMFSERWLMEHEYTLRFVYSDSLVD